MPDVTPLLRARDVAARLQIPRTSIYRIPFLRQKAIRVSPRCVRWDPKDVELYLTLQQGRRAA